MKNSISIDNTKWNPEEKNIGRIIVVYTFYDIINLDSICSGVTILVLLWVQPRTNELQTQFNSIQFQMFIATTTTKKRITKQKIYSNKYY